MASSTRERNQGREYARASLGIVPGLPEGMRPFQQVPRAIGRYLAFSLLPVLALVACVASPLPLLNAFPAWNHGWQGLALIVCGFSIGAFAMFKTVGPVSFRLMALMHRDDLVALGPSKGNERYVGIAYCDNE
jgi:hypothetical protein